MSSSITVWTSSSTHRAEPFAARLVRAAKSSSSAYDSISLVGCDIKDAEKKLNDSFNGLVSMAMSDSTLHILAVVPLYEVDSVHQIDVICDACAALEHKITLHVLCLANGILHVLESDNAAFVDRTAMDETLKYIKSRGAVLGYPFSYTVIDDYAANGAPVGFTLKSLSRFFAYIQLALMQDYYAILSPALLAAHQGWNLSVGVASLSFDRKAMADQLLGLGFLASLDAVGINDKGVDAQKAAHEAELFLDGIAKRYPALFERSIRPLYKDKELDKGRVVAQAASILDDDIEKLKSDILSLLTHDGLSLPEKEAVLAMILGRDHENIRGMQYEHDGTLLDDACEQPINLYVDAFNRFCKDSRLLPVRGDFEVLKKYSWNDTEKKLEESPENQEALNPLSDIKHLKQEIINTTSFIREKSEELEDLQKSVKRRSDVDEIKRRWRKPVGGLETVEYKEQPLDDKYTPSAGLRIKDAVDLRKFFGPVKNQMALGACTSFAVAAMYEAMMRRAGVEDPKEMSPAYLYYYSNILNGRPGGGSNFYEQLEVIGKHGICCEDLFAYDSGNPAISPSAHADEDAKQHRVLSAKQIALMDNPDKLESMRHNHAMLTSALSEGFPVGISLKIYENFGADGPFILHPDDSVGAKEDGWHAMVVVGYSEMDNFYIVRNSWGEDFGEGGYCFIPSAYIDDADYMDFACIITEISDNSASSKVDVPTVIANFAAAESEIRIAAIRNAVAKMRVELKNYQKLYAEYYKYYQRLVMQLTMPKVQNNIRDAAEAAQTINYIDAEEQKRQLEDSFVLKLKDFKKHLWKVILSLVLFALFFAVCWYASKSHVYGVGSLAFVGLSAVAFMGYKWWVRIKRRHLQEELDNVAMDARLQSVRLVEMQIRFHVAGMWLNRFHRLSLDIENVYDRLVSYISTLRAWQKNYSSQIDTFEIPDGQMFRTLGELPLFRAFFEQNKSKIVNRIDLIKLFGEYQIDPQGIESAHQRMCDTVSDAICTLLNDFNIVNFLLGDRFPYLAPVSLQNEIATLLNVGQPTCRNKAMNATSPVRIIMADVKPDRESQWASVTGKYFPLRPAMLHLPDPTMLLLLTLHPISDELM